MDLESPHLPQPAPIESYGKGGFRFGGMSHRGSLLCRPDGIWASDVRTAADLTEKRLQTIVAALPPLDFFMIGTGTEPWPLPASLRAIFRIQGVSVDTMTTGAAVRTLNVLLAENRRVGALLIAVE